MIKFSVNPFFFVIFFFALIHGFIYDVLLLFVIVLIHELGHACTALSYGWRVKRVELLPFGGVVEVDEHGNRPIKEEALVIVAGPLMNIIMIVVAWLCLRNGIWKEAFAYQFLEYNLIILIFNLLPIWPLDGGKFLQLIMSLIYPFKKAIRHSLLVSGVCFCVYVIVVALFFPYYFYLWIVAIFLVLAQWLEVKQSHYQFLRFLLERHRDINKMNHLETSEVTSITISSQQRVKDVVATMYRHKFHYFCLVDHRGQLQHVVHEQQMLDYYFTQNKAHCTCGQLFG